MSNLICVITSHDVTILRSWLSIDQMDVKFQPRPQDIFNSSTAKEDCEISSSESTFVLTTCETFSSSWNMVVNPFQRIPGYIGPGISLDKGLFRKFWITRTEVIQKNCYQSIILVTWKTEMPRKTYSWQKDVAIKLFSPLTGIGVPVKTQNTGVERR